MSTPSLHPRIAEVIAALEAAQQDMQQTLAGIPPELVDRQPADGGWSITGVVEHLMMIEDGSGRLIGGMLKQLAGTVDEETDAITPTLERFQVWNPQRRIEAPEFVKPTGVPFAEAVPKQAAARARLISALTAGSGRALHTMSHPHPILGPLTGYQWALLTAQHQRRHLVQIASIAKAVA